MANCDVEARMGIQSAGRNRQKWHRFRAFSREMADEKVAGHETFAKHLRLTSEVKS
jgi:hypothetical protein